MYSYTCESQSTQIQAGRLCGTYFDVAFSFCGVASVAGFVLNGANKEIPVTAFSNFFQIGFAFALGIMFAIIIAGPTSGGHFNPAVTICLAIWFVIQTIPMQKFLTDLT